MVNASGQYVDANGVTVTRDNRVRQPNGIAENRFIVPTYDHDAQIFRSALINIQTLSLSQNRASTNYSIGYSRTRQASTVLGGNDALRHSTARVNIDHRWKDRLQVGLSASYSMGKELPANISLVNLPQFASDVNLRAPATSGAQPYVRFPDSQESFVNPLVTQLESDIAVRRQRTLLTLNISARTTSWLTFDAIGSYDRAYRDYKQHANVQELGNGKHIEHINVRTDSVAFGQFQGGATATRSLQRLTAQLSLRGTTEREASQQANIFDSRTITPGDSDILGGSSQSWQGIERRIVAGISNLNLDYSGKYVADFALRREGNSTYHSHKEWTTFVRGSAAWLLNEEMWLPFEKFNLFKLRYSVGTSETPGQGFFFYPLPFPGQPFPAGPEPFHRDRA